MVSIPTTITSARKKVVKPSMWSMPPKAGPGCALAKNVAPRAVASASRLRCPNTEEDRLRRIGSSTMSSVPAIVRMISGRKRRTSSELKAKLTGIGHLHLRPCCRSLNPDRHVDAGLLEDVRGDLADGRQKGLRVDAHPNHHDDQGNYCSPVARDEIAHVRSHLGIHFAVENPLVHPQHVARRENHADRGVDGPREVGERGTLKH